MIDKAFSTWSVISKYELNYQCGYSGFALTDSIMAKNMDLKNQK